MGSLVVQSQGSKSEGKREMRKAWKENPLRLRTVHGGRGRNLSIGLLAEAQPLSSGEAEKLMMLGDGVVVVASSGSGGRGTGGGQVNLLRCITGSGYSHMEQSKLYA